MESKWNTPSGRKVRMITEHETERVVNADGHKVSVPADEINIKHLDVDGSVIEMAVRTVYKGQPVLRGSLANRQTAYVGLPAHIEEQVWGDYDRRRQAARAAEAEVDRKIAELHRRIEGAE